MVSGIPGVLLFAALERLDPAQDQFLIVQQEEEGTDEACDGRDDRSIAVARSGLGYGDGGEHDHGQCLSHLKGKGAGGKEHAAAVLTGFQPAELSHVGDTGLREDAEDGHGNRSTYCDDEAPVQAFPAKGSDQEDKGIGEEAGDNELFLAQTRCELVDNRVQTDADECHGGRQHECPGVLNLHELGFIEGKAGLEKCQCEEVNHIAVDEVAELIVPEGLQQRTEGIGLAGLAVNVVTFLDVEGGNQHGDTGDRCHDGHSQPDGTRLSGDTFQHAGKVG